jgi:putative sterol carrier protein
MLRRLPARPADPGYLVTPEGEPNAAPATTAPTHQPSIRELIERKGQEKFIAFLTGKTDEQLERVVGNRFTLGRIFRGMERQFQPARAAGFEGDIQYVLTTRRGEYPWAIDIHGGRATVRPARASSPALTLTMSVPTFARILTQELEPGRAWLDGSIKIEGDMPVAARLGDMFGSSRF